MNKNVGDRRVQGRNEEKKKRPPGWTVDVILEGEGDRSWSKA